MKRGLDQETKQSSANPVDIGVQDIIRQRAYELYEERGRGEVRRRDGALPQHSPKPDVGRGFAPASVPSERLRDAKAGR